MYPDSEQQTTTEQFAPCASRAVGVQKWYVAVVLNNTGKASAEKLSASGHNVFLPTQVYFSIWKDGRRKKRERIVLPNLLFVRCTEKERLEIVQQPFVRYFLTDKAGTPNEFGRRPVATIPEGQIKTFKFMLDQADEEICFNEFHIIKGMKVQVIKGSLRGLEGIVTELNSSKTRVHVNMDILGSVSVLLDSSCVRMIN